MDGGAWWAAVHGVAESWIRLSDFTFTFHFHALEKEMATHSSVLAWRIPGTGEPGGLQSMGSHRVRHDWSDLAAAASIYLLGKKERGREREEGRKGKKWMKEIYKKENKKIFTKVDPFRSALLLLGILGSMTKLQRRWSTFPVQIAPDGNFSHWLKSTILVIPPHLSWEHSSHLNLNLWRTEMTS